MSAVHRSPPTLRQTGFTLMEMLAALVLFATASSLIWQALATLSRLEARLADSALFATDYALRVEWLRQSIAGATTGPAGEPLKPYGDAREFVFISSRPPWPGTLGPVPVRLVLEIEGEHTRLVASPARWHPSSQAPRWLLATWPGSGQWRFLDHAGHWRDTWPPALDISAEEPPPPRLPRAVMLVGLPQGVWLGAIATKDNPMPRRVDLEQ